MSADLFATPDYHHRFHQPLLHFSRQRVPKPGEIVRIFELQAGEALEILGVDGADCLYVLSGEARLQPGQGAELVLLAGGEQERSHAVLESGGRTRVTALRDSVLYHLDQGKLDFMIAWDELIRSLDQSESRMRERLELISNSLAFRRLPVENIREAVDRMGEISVAAGQEIVTEGTPGDTYFVIAEGAAEVWQQGLEDAPSLVNRLARGEAFGEEALITGKNRSATVRMSSSGRLLTLGREDFASLVSGSMIRWVEPPVAKAMLEAGSQLLDVRYQEELEFEGTIPGYRLIPLQELRQRTDELNPEESYVVFCRSGQRSAIATLLLSQRKFRAVALEGGIGDWPYEKT